jgi:hypothetical protein
MALVFSSKQSLTLTPKTYVVLLSFSLLNKPRLYKNLAILMTFSLF